MEGNRCQQLLELPKGRKGEKRRGIIGEGVHEKEVEHVKVGKLQCANCRTDAF